MATAMATQASNRGRAKSMRMASGLRFTGWEGVVSLMGLGGG
ncbi:MAG: hypothetical protein ABIY86_10265 [Rhodoferax sp.]